MRMMGMVAVSLLGIFTLQAAERVRLAKGWKFTRHDPAGAEKVFTLPAVTGWLDGMGRNFLNDSAVFIAPTNVPGVEIAYVNPTFDDARWNVVRVPHDWGVDEPFSYDNPFYDAYLKPTGTGWYRRSITLPVEKKGQRVYLDFGGVMSYSMVWINGKFVGGWPYGYASFRVDLTPHFRFGEKNTLAIRVHNPDDSTRWYTGAGIYRDVFLTTCNPVHVEDRGVFVTIPTVVADEAEVAVSVTIRNHHLTQQAITVESSVYEWEEGGKGSRVQKGEPEKVMIASGRTTVKHHLWVEEPELWSLEHPNLYCVETVIRDAKGEELDRALTRFGIRTIGFYADERGFQLNGRRVQLKGVCMHHDLGVLGAAYNHGAMKRRLHLLRKAGVNAIRMSHNQPAEGFLDLCDEMGFVVKDEIFDQWNVAKHKQDYNRLYKTWWERDVRSWIRADRNHPSVIMWSLGNEIQDSFPDMKLYLESGKKMNRIAHQEDPTRPTTCANNNWKSGFSGFEKVMDIFGYNYQGHHYARFRKENPEVPLFGSETACTMSTRGFYIFPISKNWNEAYLDFRSSSYDWSACNYYPKKRQWACPPDDEWRDHEKNPAVMGEFIWTGFDYLGGPYFSNDLRKKPRFSDPKRQAQALQEVKEKGMCKGGVHSCATGFYDLAGFPKDRFYLYQSHWLPEKPMAHLLPHWNWPDRVGKVTPVYLYTTGDEAELFVNGVSQGRRKKEAFVYRLMWNEVVYAPGTVRAVAYKNGKKWAETSISTTGSARKIVVTPEEKTILSDGEMIGFVQIHVEDAEGRRVPDANHRVRVQMRGPGEILATDNGDEADFESFRSPNRNLFQGALSVLVRGKENASGRLEIVADADGLEIGTATIRLKRP